MEKFHIWDVISVLNLLSVPSGRSSYYIPCPCCDSKPRGKHLNINLRKEVFRCPKCGVSGGIFDLYALYTGIPRDVEQILELYMPLIDKHSYVNGRLDEDLKQFLMIHIALQIRRFPI